MFKSTTSITQLVNEIFTAEQTNKQAAIKRLEELYHQENNSKAIAAAFKDREFSQDIPTDTLSYADRIMTFLHVFSDTSEKFKNSLAEAFFSTNVWSSRKNTLDLEKMMEKIKTIEDTFKITVSITDMLDNYLFFMASPNKASMQPLLSISKLTPEQIINVSEKLSQVDLSSNDDIPFMVKAVNFLIENAQGTLALKFIKNNISFAEKYFDSLDETVRKSVYDGIKSSIIEEATNKKELLIPDFLPTAFHPDLMMNAVTNNKSVSSFTLISSLTKAGAAKIDGYASLIKTLVKNPSFYSQLQQEAKPEAIKNALDSLVAQSVEENIKNETDTNVLCNWFQSDEKLISTLAYERLMALKELKSLTNHIPWSERNVTDYVPLLKRLHAHGYVLGTDTVLEQDIRSALKSRSLEEHFKDKNTIKFQLFLMKLMNGEIWLSTDDAVNFIESLQHDDDINTFKSIESIKRLEFHEFKPCAEFCEKLTPEKRELIAEKLEPQQDSWLLTRDTIPLENQFAYILAENPKLPKSLIESYRPKLLAHTTDPIMFTASSPAAFFFDKFTTEEKKLVIEHLLKTDNRIITVNNFFEYLEASDVSQTQRLYEKYGNQVVKSIRDVSNFGRFLKSAPENTINTIFNSAITDLCKTLAVSHLYFNKEIKNNPNLLLTPGEQALKDKIELFNSTYLNGDSSPSYITSIRLLIPGLMTRVENIFKLLCDEQLAGKLRHQGTSTQLKTFIESEVFDRKVWDNLYNQDPLLREAWKLACILDDKERIKETYLAVFKQTTFGVSKATGSTIFFTASLRKDLSKLQTDAVQEGKRMHKVLAAIG